MNQPKLNVAINPIEIIKSPNPLDIYHLGPSLEAGPLPSVFYFALSGSDSLLLDPFNQFIQFLDHQPIRRFSFTLPGHGPGLKNEDAIKFVAGLLEKGEDPIAPFLDLALENIHFLIEKRLVDPLMMATAGLSRGGFFASLLALKDERIKTIIAFAPITNLSFLIPEGKSYDLINYIDQFAYKTLRFYIGNRDQRVSTDLCFQFIRKTADLAFEKGIRSPPIELLISPSIGHMGHGTSPDTFRNGADWFTKFLNNTNT